MIKATAQEIEGFGRIVKRAGTDKGLREIRGFVSTSNMDRQGDTIDPVLFDVETFIKNPQVFVDHKPWLTEKGNAISVGTVSSLVPAKAKENDKGGFDIISLENDEVIDTVSKEEAGIVENDMKGLWGVLSIMEKDVIDLINTGRLNAFSWRGDLVETRFGKHIDLMEVSLVFIPANSKALFMITKSAVRDTESYVIIKGGGMFADISKLPDNVAAVVDTSVPRYCLHIKHESGRAEIMELSLGNDQDADAFSASVYGARADVESVTLLKHTFLMTDHEEPIYEVMNDLSRTEMIRAQWTRAYINTLADSAFGYVEPGGKKDESGLTAPRSLRHFPLKDKNGKYDEAHVRNALARMSQSEFGDKAKPKILAAARALGIEVSNKSIEDELADSGHNTNLEGGEEDMPISKEDTESIASAVGAAMRAEFQKVLDTLEETSVEEETKTEASAEETKAEETKVEEAEKSTETAVDVAALISEAVRTALAEPMEALAKRMEKLEGKPSVETQQATETDSETETETVEKKKSFAEIYNAATDPKEKRSMRLRLLSEAMFGPESRKAVNS